MRIKSHSFGPYIETILYFCNRSQIALVSNHSLSWKMNSVDKAHGFFQRNNLMYGDFMGFEPVVFLFHKNICEEVLVNFR